MFLINDLPIWPHKLLTAGLISFLVVFVRLFSDRSRYFISWRTEFFMLLPSSLEHHLQMCLQQRRQYCRRFFFLCPLGEQILEGCDLLMEFHYLVYQQHIEFSVMKSHHYSLSNWHTGFEAYILMQWVLQCNSCMKKVSLCVFWTWLIGEWERASKYTQ